MKKLIAIALCLSVILTVMCACKPNDKDRGSSTNIAVESSDVQNESSDYSENKTSSIADEDDETSSSKKDESSKKDIAEESSSEKTSSKNFDREPSAASSTISASIKLPDIEGSTLEVGAFNFNTIYATNYGTYSEVTDTGSDLIIYKRLEEIEDVLSQGYFNTIILEAHHFTNETLWELLEAYKMKVWFNIWGLYDSSYQTIEEFMATYDPLFQWLQKYPERWKMFNGVLYDENVHRNQSVEDFNETCKYIYTKYGKRNFPVFAPQEISKLWNSSEWPGKMTAAGFEYVTDVSFDVYSVDLREGRISSDVTYASGVYPQITDGKSFYRTLMELTTDMAGHPVNVWFYPSGETLGNGHEEAFCLGHLQGFEQLLKEYEHPGGLIIYCYAQWSEGKYGLQSHLYVPDKEGKQKIRPHEDQVWHSYSKFLKELTMRFRNQKTNPVLKIPGK